MPLSLQRSRAAAPAAAILLLLCLPHAPAVARADSIAGPCALFQVPRPLALAIARVESGGHPLVLNIAGRDVTANSREEAAALAARAMAAGRSVDIGLMQINDWWLRRLGISPAAVLDPANNVLLGLWILHQETRRHGRTWAAVGAYHSPRSHRQAAYARRVARQYAALTGERVRGRLHDAWPGERR